MTAILEFPEVRQRVSPLSGEEYHRLGSQVAPEGTVTCDRIPAVSAQLSGLFA